MICAGAIVQVDQRIQLVAHHHRIDRSVPVQITRLNSVAGGFGLAEIIGLQHPAVAAVQIDKILLRPMQTVGCQYIEVTVAVDIGQSHISRVIFVQIELPERMVAQGYAFIGCQ